MENTEKIEKESFLKFDLTWKKLIIFAIAIGVAVGLLMIPKPLKDTSAQDIGTGFEWWVLFGTLIIYNSKSYADSALKCFVFFLISQPIIYLVQVPFYYDGFGIFGYYRHWFIITLFTFPMGFVGYYIKKNNPLSALILSSMTALLALHVSEYVNMCMKNPPRHLLSALFSLAFIFILTFGVLSSKRERLICLAITLAAVLVFFGLAYLGREKVNTVYNVFDDGTLHLEINSDWKIYIYGQDGTGEIIDMGEEDYYIRLIVVPDRNYEFELVSPDGRSYMYDYRYNKDGSILLELKE